jgi:hypothetical protein
VNVSFLRVKVFIERGPDYAIRVDCDTELLGGFTDVSIVPE